MTVAPMNSTLCTHDGGERKGCKKCGGIGWYVDHEAEERRLERQVQRAAGKLEAEVKRRNEWYGLDNWGFEEVARFVLRTARNDP